MVVLIPLVPNLTSLFLEYSSRLIFIIVLIKTSNIIRKLVVLYRKFFIVKRKMNKELTFPPRVLKNIVWSDIRVVNLLVYFNARSRTKPPRELL